MSGELAFIVIAAVMVGVVGGIRIGVYLADSVWSGNADSFIRKENKGILYKVVHSGFYFSEEYDLVAKYQDYLEKREKRKRQLNVGG